MSKGKRVKKKQPFVDIYGVLLLVATLVMSIGYAEIVGTTMTVETRAEASSQEGVFITDVICNESNSVSNNYLATTMDTSITLDSPTDTKKFTVTIYNKTVKPQVFIGVIKSDKMDEFDGNYTNTNISYTLGSNIVPHETILPAKDWITFDVELGFNGEGTMPETLRSLLNFRFQEVPTIQISDISAIENVYPNYTPQEITFTVSNQRQDEKQGLITNGVPLTYTIAPNVQAPLTAKIYDENGQEVATNKEITISSEAKEEHIYILKIFWDNTKSVQGKEYNSAEYAGQILSSSIKVTATPTDENEKYLGYERIENKVFEVKTAPMYFDVSTDKTTVEMNNTTNAEEMLLTIKNNDGTNTNKFETEYKLSIDNDKFTLLVNGSELGEEILTLGNTGIINQEHAIQLVSKDGQELEAITPYAKTETIELTIKDTTGPTAPVIEGGSTGTYAISQTISVSEVSTDVGTGVNKYQYLLNSDGTKTAEAIADVTTTEASQTFTQDAPGYYVYFRAVDKAGNVGEWSNAQQIYIDTAEPTVGLADGVNSEITIEEGTQNDVASYFKYDKNGNAGIKEVTYTVNGKTIANTSELTEGTHTIICTVTKETNISKSANITVIVESSGPVDAGSIAENPDKFYGASVNYEDPAGDPTVGWQILHADGENIYLIADDYVHYTYVPEDVLETDFYPAGEWKSLTDYHIILKPNNNGIDVIKNSNWTNPLALKWLSLMIENGKSEAIGYTADLMKTVSWDVLYRNPSYAEYTIGGPTIEMVFDVVKSYTPSANNDALAYNASSGYYNYCDNDYYDGYYDLYIKTNEINEWLFRNRDTGKVFATRDMFSDDYWEMASQKTEELWDQFWLAGPSIETDNLSTVFTNAVYLSSVKLDQTYNEVWDRFAGGTLEVFGIGMYADAWDMVYSGEYEGSIRDYLNEYYPDCLMDYPIYVNFPGVRPVVCLKSDITLEKAEDGSYNLVAPPVTAAEVAADPATYYGASVNYEDPAGDPTVGWQIFHSDGENIYLIADDYVHYTYVPEDVIETEFYPAGAWKSLTDYNIVLSLNNNGLNALKNPNWTNPLALKWLSLMMENETQSEYKTEQTASLMKTISWDALYRNSVYAEYTIGSPTIEMAVDALNAYNDWSEDVEYRESFGYRIDNAENDSGVGSYIYWMMDSENIEWLFRLHDSSKTGVSGDMIHENYASVEYLDNNKLWLAGYAKDWEGILDWPCELAWLSPSYAPGSNIGMFTTFQTGEIFVSGESYEDWNFMEYWFCEHYKGDLDLSFQDFLEENGSSGYYTDYPGYLTFPGIRPVVCLKSNVQLKENSNGSYDFVEPEVSVIPNESVLEIEEGEGEGHTFDSLFTVTTKDGGTPTITYTLNGETSSGTSNTSILPLGTHTIKCTATYNGMTTSTSVIVKIKVNLPDEETYLLQADDGTAEYTFTIPEGVNVVRVYIKKMRGSAFSYVFATSSESTEIWVGTNNEGEALVGVTPGKTYKLKGLSNCYIEISYSSSINEQIPSVYDL